MEISQIEVARLNLLQFSALGNISKFQILKALMVDVSCSPIFVKQLGWVTK
jgi:hypothetical protein